MYSLKTSLLSWWLICILAIFFWCRDYRYDRVIAAFAMVLALIQLIEYGIFNNMDLQQATKLLICVIWLLVFTLALSVLIYTKNASSLICWLLITIIFLVSAFYAFTSSGMDNISLEDGRLNWGDITNGMVWVFIVSLIIPLLILLNYYNWEDLSIYLILIYLVVSIAIIWYTIEPKYSFSVFIYSLIGILFIVWFTGMFT